MTVAELIEKLKTMPPDAKVIHINYRGSKNNTYSDPDVFLSVAKTNALSKTCVSRLQCGR